MRRREAALVLRASHAVNTRPTVTCIVSQFAGGEKKSEISIFSASKYVYDQILFYSILFYSILSYLCTLHVHESKASTQKWESHSVSA